MTRPFILLTDPVHEVALQRLGDAEVVILPDLRAETYRSLMRKAHILVVRSGSPLPDDFLDDAPNLIGIVRHGAGIDVIPMPAAQRLLIPVANVPGGNAQAVAEHGAVLMGMLTRRIHQIDQAMRSQGWSNALELTSGLHNLSGKTAGIVGVGEIGGRLARICSAGYGMNVLGHQRRLDKMPEYVRPADLTSLFSDSDFVVLCCPLTPETRHLCSSHRLNMMKPSAFLINLARGGIVDTASLTAALEAGRLAGAGLDVFEEEPLPQDHPLLRNDRVILTPHSAARTYESFVYNGEMAITQVLQLLDGTAPMFLVNPKVWDQGVQRRTAIITSLKRR